MNCDLDQDMPPTHIHTVNINTSDIAAVGTSFSYVTASNYATISSGCATCYATDAGKTKQQKLPFFLIIGVFSFLLLLF